jgi:hypothetical protein
VQPKKRKDPAAPRAASNAYMIFCKEKRSAVSEQHPELSFGQVGSKLGETWRTMSAAEKKQFEDRAAADRDRYRKAMEAYGGGNTNAVRARVWVWVDFPSPAHLPLFSFVFFFHFLIL